MFVPINVILLYKRRAVTYISFRKFIQLELNLEKILENTSIKGFFFFLCDKNIFNRKNFDNILLDIYMFKYRLKILLYIPNKTDMVIINSIFSKNKTCIYH